MKTKIIKSPHLFGKGLLAVLSASFLFIYFSSLPVYSSMEPREIQKINDNAPYHVIGTVIEDQLVRQLSDSKEAPVQLRKMRLEIIEINRVPRNEPIRSVEVSYTFIPSWVDRDGGKGMDIAEGDVIEIWLDEGEFGLEPAASGDSVNHIAYANNRPEHLPEPFRSKASHFGRSFLTHPHTVGNVVVLSGLATFSLLLAVFGIKKMRHSN